MPEAAKEPPHEFPTTWWTLIEQALADGTTARTTALHELVLRYAPPLRAHLLLRKRLDAESADELLQSFVTEKIVAQYLLRHADRDKGRFRSLLVRSLENYLADWGRARAGQPLTAMTGVLEEIAAEPAVDADTFDVAWARQVLDEVLAQMQADCEASGQADVWGVFQSRLLAPVREGCEPLPYEEVCRRFAFASPEHASNALVTAKRKFQRAFQRVAARYQHDGEQAEDVLRELIGVLSRAGPLEWKQIPECLPAAAASQSRDALDDSQPALVARLLELGPGADELWRSEDLAGLMRHQLAQRLADLDLAILAGSRDVASGPTGAAPIVTLADLYADPAPPLEVLDAVKRYGRKRVHRADTMLPDEIASALYFASIAAALVCHAERITKSDNELLRWSFERLLETTWIEPPIRGLFEQGLARLGDGGDAA